MSDLAPILAAVLGPMLVFVVASMRYQHLDSTKTRDLIEKNRDLIEASSKDNRRLIEKNRDLIEASSKDNRRLIEKNRDLIEASHKENRDLIEQSNKETRDLFRASHAELSGSLADARERLARIEGHLRISPPPQQGASDGDGDARAA